MAKVVLCENKVEPSDVVSTGDIIVTTNGHYYRFEQVGFGDHMLISLESSNRYTGTKYQNEMPLSELIERTGLSVEKLIKAGQYTLTLEY